MHQGGDYTSSTPFYQPPPPPTSSSQFPNPNSYQPDPNSLLSSTYASAPPFSPSDYSNYPPPPSQQQPTSSQTYQLNQHQPYHLVTDAVIAPSPPVHNHAYDPPALVNPSFTAPVQHPTAFPSFESHSLYAPLQQQQGQYNSQFEQHQGRVSYVPVLQQPPQLSESFPGSGNSPYSGSYNLSGYDSLYESSHVKFDQGGAAVTANGGAVGGYFDNGVSGYDGYNNKSKFDLGSNYYGKNFDSGTYSGQNDDLYGDGVYAYQAKNKVEPYGARGTGSKSSTWTGVFDDYGRAISFPVLGEKNSSTSSPKIVKAEPKVDTQQDVQSGVQKFRVKLLAESGGQSTMDILCQIGLDGVRMLDPSTNRTLRIYPLETITSCDVTDSSIFTFWSKSSVDIEPKRIRLQSNRYTTSTILDIVTAATVQIKEMGGTSRPEYTNSSELQPEKKKGITDWMNIIKPANEEKDHWVPDEAVMKCTACGTDFGAFVRRHHCRNCGDIFCDKCTHGRIALTAEENAQLVRVCDRCLAEVTQRLSNAKELANQKSAGLQSHQDLAKKLQEEMERNRKGASGSKSEGSGTRTKEVACPTCTVHLQVQVPSSGSETIECGVCQHPFLVSAH